jgi:hypothetical protein
VTLGIASGAQAGPAMFSASMIMPAFGNDTVSGTVYPYNQYVWIGMPIGHDCQDASPNTPNGATNTRYCPNSVIQAGSPATGSGYLVTGGATVGAPVGLPQSAFSVDVTGFNRTYYPYLQSHTYGNFVNYAGTFLAGSGPAFGKGTHTHSGMGQQSGQWYIHEGARGFGGVLKLLGAVGVKHFKWVLPGKVGTYSNTSGNWQMVTALGRDQYATVYSITAMGKTNWFNPHTGTEDYLNNVNGNTSRLAIRAIGTRWTTGSVTLFAKAGYLATVFRKAGFDTVTEGGVRNIQLVTPNLVHWVGPGSQTHTGHIAILTMQITPEPGAILLLAAGGGVLALLYRANSRS